MTTIAKKYVAEAAKNLPIGNDMSKYLVNLQNLAYRNFQKNAYENAAEKIDTILRKKGMTYEKYPEIRSIVISEMQSGKSMTGSIFQQSVIHILNCKEIPFSETVGKTRRTDIIIYSDLLKVTPYLALAIKYNLRERWKQVLHEAYRHIPIFLVTLDADITAAVAEKVFSEGVVIIHPKPYHRDMKSFDSFIESLRKEKKQ